MSAQVSLQTIRNSSSYPFVYATPQAAHVSPATSGEQVHAAAAENAATSSYQQQQQQAPAQQHQQQSADLRGSSSGDMNADLNGGVPSSSTTSILNFRANYKTATTTPSTSTSTAPAAARAPTLTARLPSSIGMSDETFTYVPDPGIDKSRWSSADDVALADALVEQKRLGRNRDTIYSADAWNEIGEIFAAPKWPGTGGAKALHQCKSRWQRLKIEYRNVKQLRTLPGFSWDESLSMVIANDGIWDIYVAQHRNATPWRKKTFPAYVQVAWLLEDDGSAGEQLRLRWESRAKEAQGQGGVEGDSVISATAGFVTAPSSASVSGAQQQPFRRSYQKRQKPSSDENNAFSKRTKSNASTPAPATPQSTSFTVSSYAPASYVPSPIPPQPVSMPMPTPIPTVSAPVSTPPSRMALAIQTAEENEGLTDTDLVRTVQLFQRRTEASDAYLAIQSRRARSLYLRAELEEFSRTPQPT